MAVYKPRSRACISTSRTFFSSMALPICTAPPLRVSDWSVSSSDEKVAPWMPSRPVRPPIATIKSPGMTCLTTLSTGTVPTVPQNTNGLAR